MDKLSLPLKRAVICFGFLLTVSQAQIAIIVHPSNALDDLSLEELRSVYNGDKALFNESTEILLVEYRFIAEDFYQLLYNKSRIKMKKYWISLVFSGRSANPPSEKQTVEEVLAFVAKNAGAIAFIPLEQVDDNIKTITLNGLSAGDPDYPLK